MALFKILQGPDVRLLGDGVDIPAKDLHEGYCYFTTDNNLFYVDYNKIIDGVKTLVRSPLNAHSSYFLYKSDGTEAFLTDDLTDGKDVEIPTSYAIHDYFLDENHGIMHLKMDKANPNGTGSFGLNVPEGTSLGENAVALNSGNKATGTNTFCAGKGTVSDTPEQFIIGRFNELNTAYSFAIGGGSSDTDRKNLFSIDWEGTATLLNTLTLSDPTAQELEDSAKPGSFAATRGYAEELVQQTVYLTVIQ